MSVIMICGLNGSGKTTLGKALSEVLKYKFLNDEDYYFMESKIPFSKSRTDEEAREYIVSYIEKYKNVVITATRGDLGNKITLLFDYVIYLSAPIELRIWRIENREHEMFGTRVLPGGDMYEQQNEFRKFVLTRTTEKIENWLKTLECKVIKLDGTKPIDYNVDYIRTQL